MTLNAFLGSLATSTYQQSSTNHFLSGFVNLFSELTIQDVEDLMVGNWSSIKNYAEFIKIALYLDSKKINALAQTEIAGIKDRRWIFNDLHWTFGVNVKGKSELITIEKLER